MTDQERDELKDRWEKDRWDYPMSHYVRYLQLSERFSSDSEWDVMENGERRWAERRKNEPDWGA